MTDSVYFAYYLFPAIKYVPQVGPHSVDGAHCGLSVVRGADASTRVGSDRITLRTMQGLEVNSTHERGTIAAASYLPF